MVVRQLVTAIGFKVNTGQLRTAELAVRNATNTIAALGAQMSVALTLPMLLVGKSFITAADDIERTRIKLEAFTGSADAANKMLNELWALADRSPFKARDIGDIGATLLARGTEPEELLDTLTMLGDVTAGVNGNLNLIGINYAQVREKNILLSRDLREFANQGIPLMDALVEVTGRSQDVLRGTGRTGKATFKEVEAAFKLLTKEGGKFHKMMERIALGTISGRFSIFLDKLFRVSGDFGDLLKPIAMDTIAFLIDALKWVKSLSSDVKRFILILGGVLGVTGPIILAIKLILFLLNPIRAVFASILFIISLIVDEFVVWRQGGRTVIGELLGDFKTFKRDMKKLTEDLSDDVRTALSILKEVFAEVWLALVDKAKSGEFKDMIKDLTKSFIGFLRDALIGVAQMMIGFMRIALGMKLFFEKRQVGAGLKMMAAGTIDALKGLTLANEGINIKEEIERLKKEAARVEGVDPDAVEREKLLKERGGVGKAPVPSPVIDTVRDILGMESRMAAHKRETEAFRRSKEAGKFKTIGERAIEMNVNINEINSNATDSEAVANEVISKVKTEMKDTFSEEMLAESQRVLRENPTLQVAQ